MNWIANWMKKFWYALWFAQACVIAFTSEFIPREAYRYTEGEGRSLQGYMDFSLSYFNTSYFEVIRGNQGPDDDTFPVGPDSPYYNKSVSICRWVFVNVVNGLPHLKSIHPLWKILETDGQGSVHFLMQLPSVQFSDKVYHRGSKYFIWSAKWVYLLEIDIPLCCLFCKSSSGRMWKFNVIAQLYMIANTRKGLFWINCMCI